VVEVLSPSTMDYGRGGKLKFYKSLPTLRHVAPIYRDQMRVETFERTDEGWRIHVSTAPEGVLRSDAVDLEIDLDRTRFDAPCGDRAWTPTKRAEPRSVRHLRRPGSRDGGGPRWRRGDLPLCGRSSRRRRVVPATMLRRQVLGNEKAGRSRR